MIDVKVINKSNNELPKYETEGAVGMDLRANLVAPPEGKYIEYKGNGFKVILKEDKTIQIILDSRGRILIPTGIHIQLPHWIEAQIRPRSGLSVKYGISIVNTPGTIDEDYTGEVHACLLNTGDKEFVINNGDRIAQMVFNPIVKIVWTPVDKLDNTKRGEGGHGHTGI